MGSLPWFPLCTRDAAAHMASRAQVFYLPVGTNHHFSELAQILSLLQKELRGPAVRGTAARTTGLSPLLLALPQPRALPAFALPPWDSCQAHLCLSCLCVHATGMQAHGSHLLSASSALWRVPQTVSTSRALEITWSNSHNDQKINGNGLCPRSFKA